MSDMQGVDSKSNNDSFPRTYLKNCNLKKLLRETAMNTISSKISIQSPGRNIKELHF